MNIKKVLIFSVIALWLTAVLVAGGIVEYLKKPLPIPEEGFVLVVDQGESLSHVARQLEQNLGLKWPKLFVVYARLTGQTKIKAGEYLLPEALPTMELLPRLTTGRVIEYSVTIPEGFSYKEMLSVLHTANKLQPKLVGKSEQEQIQLLGVDENNLEGWFFPDTYRYVAGNSDVDILQRAYKKMQEVLAEEWEQRIVGLPYNTPYEALIMASIVEKETGVASERATIAGVFVKRLQKGMRLQTDPTVIYGLGDRYQGNIKRSHLKDSNPYNTYLIKGLPPTPIALPGRDAIRAALQPEDNDYLYFVAKGDGSHHFSSTFEEHKKAVARYQILGRVDNYQSKPNAEKQVVH